MKTYYVYGGTSPKRGKKVIACEFDIGDLVQTTKDRSDGVTLIMKITQIKINNDEGTIKYETSSTDGEEYSEDDLQLVE